MEEISLLATDGFEGAKHRRDEPASPCVILHAAFEPSRPHARMSVDVWSVGDAASFLCASCTFSGAAPEMATRCPPLLGFEYLFGI